MQRQYVGKTPLRKEGVSKVNGTAQYVDDLVYPGMLHGMTVRSPVAAGELKGIRYLQGVNWADFVVVTAKDVPGENVVAFHMDDQPCLVEKTIRHREEPILLIAHENRDELKKAMKLIELHIEATPACFDIDEAFEKKKNVWGSDNIIKKIVIEKGDLKRCEDQNFASFEGEYQTSAQEQMYIEPNGMIAQMEGDVIRVEGSLQCPYYVHTALKKLFAKPDPKVRVIQTETGGAFGGKEEYPSMIACHTALLAWKSGKPVKLVYDRAEDLAATTKRHPSKTKIKSKWSSEGILKSLDIDFRIDAGAYATVSPVVLSRGAIHAAGPYRCENTRVVCHAIATNFPPYGAFRGFGAPQSIFAMERHLDEVASKMGLSPVEIRRKNMIKKGEVSSTSQVIKDDVDFEALLDFALEESDFERKQRDFKEWNKKNARFKKGMGLATFYHGAGFTGSGEKHLAAVAGLDYSLEHGVRILTASTEMGQGKNTIFCQIAADALGISYDAISIAQPDTAVVPDSGPTVASRTAMIVGWLVEKAALKMVQILKSEFNLPENYSQSDFLKAAGECLRKKDRFEVFEQYQPPGSITWDDKIYRGDAYAAYGWAAYVAEVQVDLLTYEAKVEKFYAMQDIGKVLHPLLCAGQIEGGVTQALGYALMEDVVWRDGGMQNNRMTNYIIPTSADMPDIYVGFTESPTPIGPGGGAKGVGELPMDGPAPAIVNAIQDALGVSINHIPATPERIAKIMQEMGGPL